jgi:hypothetical protein
MSRRSQKPSSAAHPVVVAFQIFLVLATLLAPIPVMAEDPSAPPSEPVATEPAATPDPTAEPTAAPTEEPTAAPTEEPTPAATDAPNSAPTDEPTTEPTSEPTTEPAELPTAAPTAEPTSEPASEPTTEPTTAPEPSSPTPTVEPSAPVAAPTIQSDLEDYPPGGLVTLTGSNWQPGESVHIFVNDDFGSSWSRNVDVIADAAGNLTDQFNLPNWFVATYSVVATGPTSAIATTSFTDANVTTTPGRFPGSGSQTISAGGFFDFTASVSRGGPPADPNPVIVGVTTTGVTGSVGCGLSSPVGLPITWLAVMSAPISVSSSSGQNVTIRASVPAGTSPGNYQSRFKFDITNGGSQTNLDFCVTVPTIASTSLSVNPASGIYGGSTNLSATLRRASDNVGISGKTIAFTLNGNPAGSATTNASGAATVTGVSLAGIAAGTHSNAIAASFGGDSSFASSSGSNTLTVSQASSTVTVDCSTGAPFTYTGSAIEPCTAQATGAGMSPIDVTDSIVYSDNTDAGTASAQASWDGDANHTGNTGSSTFDIGQAELTITADAIPSTVTVDHFSRPFGYANPPFIVRYVGFVNGETPSVLGGTLTFSTAATSSSPMGSYSVTPGGLTSTNYTIQFVAGTLDITAGYRIVGFTSPVDMTTAGGAPYWNSIKGGQTVPLKFKAYRITSAGTLGTEITTTVPLSIVVKTLSTCNGGVVDGEILPDTTGGTSFRYSDGQFIFNWATPKQANKCYRVYVHSEDGSDLMYTTTMGDVAKEAYFKSK